MPRSRDEIIALDKKFLWHPYTPMATYIAETDPIVAERAEGPYIWDRDGTRYIDANSSWWVAAFGHRHPRIVRALVEQADRMPHVSLAGTTHEQAAALASELVAIAPGHDDASLDSNSRLARAFFSDNGSTAVEVAIKIAAQYWAQNGRAKRTRFVTLSGAFHGETIGATSVGGVGEFRDVFAPLLFDVIHAPSPADANGWERALETIESILTRDGDSIAAVIVEPLVQGAEGMRMHGTEFLRGLREATRRADTFLVTDEVFTGFGRTGAAFACDVAGIVPDLLPLGKALSGGILPFAATLATQRIFDGFLGDASRALFYGHSYCGNPLGAAVARASLAVFRDERIVEQVQRKSSRVKASFARIAASVRGAANPRACGLVGAIDLGAGGYLAKSGWRVYEEARRRGAYLRPLGDTVYIAPALNIADDVLDELLRIVEASVAAVANATRF
jgi:adenosylmethionine-8-amino-7-oxononanoate aminotransferase